MNELANILKVKELESATLKQPQADCPVRHIFMPGIYMRELTIPAGVVIVGHNHKHPHISMLTKGRITVLNADGSLSELVSPQTIISGPGKKCAFAHEETVWVNVHSSEVTDVELLETLLYDKSEAPVQLKIALGGAEDARADYGLMLKEFGFTEPKVQEEVQNTEDQMPMPFGIFKCKIGDSTINGKGVFATADIAGGEVIAAANINGKRTPVGRYTNHSPDCNAEMVVIGEDVVLVATKQIRGCKGGMDGEEILTDYRHTLKLLRGNPCQQQ